jgi:hypothetical protein
VRAALAYGMPVSAYERLSLTDRVRVEEYLRLQDKKTNLRQQWENEALRYQAAKRGGRDRLRASAPALGGAGKPVAGVRRPRPRKRH